MYNFPLCSSDSSDEMDNKKGTKAESTDRVGDKTSDHLNKDLSEKGQVMLRNVAEIILIPNHSEVKIGDLNIVAKSHTLNTSRKFKNENSELFRKLYMSLLILMFDMFVTSTKDEATLLMIGNLLNFLPSTCKSEDCDELLNLPSPVTRSSQLNKFFLKSDELKSEFLKNIVKTLDWIFRKSKFLNEEKNSIDVLIEAEKFLLDSIKTKKVLSYYALKWINFNLSAEETIKEEIETFCRNDQNKFTQTFIATLVNSPLKETDKLDCHSIPLRKYLQYGSILQAAFKYITKNHRARKNNANCNCCICTNSISPEDLELLFLENMFSNMKRTETIEGNFQKVKNFIRSIDKKSFRFCPKSSRKFEEIYKNIENIPTVFSSTEEADEQTTLGKRENSKMPIAQSSKRLKVDDDQGNTENKGERRRNKKGQNGKRKKRRIVERESTCHDDTNDDHDYATFNRNNMEEDKSNRFFIGFFKFWFKTFFRDQSSSVFDCDDFLEIFNRLERSIKP